MQNHHYVVRMTTTFTSLPRRARSRCSISHGRRSCMSGVLLMAGAFFDPPGEPAQAMGS